MNSFFPYEKSFLDFFQQRYSPQQLPSISYLEDETNSQNPIGRTAFYNPSEKNVSIYITGRHVKDILRSLAHELIHHLQCERGDLNNVGPTHQGYAQDDSHMRNLEREAYEQGNLCFRDWEDNLKKSDKALYETIYNDNAFGGNKLMSITDWKNTEINMLLMEKWGYIPKDKKPLNEEVGAFLDTSKGGDYRTGQQQLPEDALKEEEEEMLEAHPHDPEARLNEDEKGHDYSGGGYLPYGEEEEIEEGTKKGEKIKTGDTEGEEAYEDPSKGEKSKTRKGEEDYTTKKGMKKKTGPGKAYVKEELAERKLRALIRSAIKEAVSK